MVGSMGKDGCKTTGYLKFMQCEHSKQYRIEEKE